MLSEEEEDEEVPVLRREVLELLFTSLLLFPRVLLLLLPLLRRVPVVPELRELLPELVRELLVLVRELFVLVRELPELLGAVLSRRVLFSRRAVPVVEVERLLLELLRRVVYTSLFFFGARLEPGRMVTEPKSERRCVL